MWDYVENSKNKKIVNIINFLSFARRNRLFLNKLFISFGNDLFIVEGGTTPQQNEKYLKIFKDYYDILCVKNKFKSPVNHLISKKVVVTLDTVSTPPEYGITLPVDDSKKMINECEIILYLNKIESSTAALPIEKTVIHELFHAIQYSYDDKEDNENSPQKYHWYIPTLPNNDQNLYYIAGKILSDTTATWVSDVFILTDPTSIFYPACFLQSLNYFFKNPKAAADLSFPAYGLMHGDNYAYSFFWNFFYAHFPKKTEDEIRPEAKMLHKIWSNVITSNPISSMISFVQENSQSNDPSVLFMDIIHNFAIKNFLVTKHIGVYTDEKDFLNFNLGNNNRSNLTIRDDKLSNSDIANVSPEFKREYSIPPMATKFIKLVPDNGNYFQNYFSMSLAWNSAFHIRPALIVAWIDVDTKDNNKPEFNYQHVPIYTSSTSGANYVYYTKKGINPKFFILAMSSDGQKNIWTEIAKVNVTISFEKPNENDATPIELITKAGENFKNNVTTIFAQKSISNMIALDSEICKLYDDYSKPGNSENKEFIANQIVQKIRNLNLMMQTCLVAVHDLRYQYYLDKNLCINKIMEGASSQSVAEQVEKLKTFIDGIKIDDYNNSINVANAYIIWNHAQIKLKTIKEVDASEWDMGQDTYDKINKISKIITGNSKYPYWYTNDELKEAVTSPFIGIPEDECPGPMLLPGMPIKGPFPVNYCPGIKRQLDLLKIPNVYSISSKLKSISITVNGTTYNASNMLCVRDKFDPLSLAYFSALKKHRYHEDNMPPVPSVSNIRNYVSLLGYYMKICNSFSLCNNEEFADLKKIMIGGASARIMEIIVLISEAIIKEKQQNKAGLYEKFKQVAFESELYTEILDLIEKQLARDGYRDLY